MSDYRSIHEVIGAYIVDLLSEKMILEQHHTDVIPYEIRQGQLQTNPNAGNGIRVLINPGDLDDTAGSTWSDVLATKDSVDGWDLPPHEIGGGDFMVRRFTIDISVFFVTTKEDRTTARQIGTYVIGKTESILRSNPYPAGLVDSFGENVIALELTRSYPIESGGPPASFIWRGKIYLQVITERP